VKNAGVAVNEIPDVKVIERTFYICHAIILFGGV